jgi:serine/threonine protein kinase
MSTLQINNKFANRYLLKKLIGVGGYSQVWLAEDSKSGNLEVAIKIFAPGQGLDDKGLELFSKEYALVFNLNHKNLLIPKHFDDFEGSPYLVMQYCQQGSVYGKIGEISETELAHFMKQSASALNYLHQQDPPIIHQDIKPDNFLIDNQGNYLLADFGISSKIRRTLTKSIGAHASTGTMAYMPPEKFTADKQIIKAGDIFSLGVTMYELLTGDLPFGENGGLTLKAGADVPNLPGNFSKELNHLLISCMAKNPWERPPAEKMEAAAVGFLQNGQWVQDGVKKPTLGPAPPKVPESPSVGRLTQPIPQPEPLLKPKPVKVTEVAPDIKNYTPWIIFYSVIVLLIIVAYAWRKDPSVEGQLEKAVADTVAMTDVDTVDVVVLDTTTFTVDEYTYSNGDYYMGSWKDGKKGGSGTLTFNNGDKYSGEWMDDMMNGEGTYIWKNGEKYVGGWKDGKMNGFAKYYDRNDKLLYEGMYSDDKPLEEFPNR